MGRGKLGSVTGKAEALRRIKEVGLVPIVRATREGDAIVMAEALREGGIPVVEITMAVPGAMGVIAALAKRFGDEVLVGAGTVMSPEQARACVAAGARFIVSPTLSVETVWACGTMGVVAIPGALTPTEVVAAWQAGADLVKVFPCHVMGGASYLKALKVPLPDIELVPTGGISLANAGEHIQAGAAALGVSSDLCGVELLATEGPGKITSRARAYVATIEAARSGKAFS